MQRLRVALIAAQQRRHFQLAAMLTDQIAFFGKQLASLLQRVDRLNILLQTDVAAGLIQPALRLLMARAKLHEAFTGRAGTLNGFGITL